MCCHSKVRGERVQTSARDVSPPAATAERLDLRAPDDDQTPFPLCENSINTAGAHMHALARAAHARQRKTARSRAFDVRWHTSPVEVGKWGKRVKS